MKRRIKIKNAKSWKKQNGGLVEYTLGGLSWGDVGDTLGSTAKGVSTGSMFGPPGMIVGGILGAASGLIGATSQNKEDALLQQEQRRNGIMSQQQSQMIGRYPNGGIINQLNNTINPTSTNTGDPNALYEVSKRYGRTRLQSTKDAGQNTTNKRLYYNVRDINTGVARDLSLDEMMLQFPNYTDTPGLGAYPMGGKIPYGQPNAELEKEEVTAAPDGSMAKFDLPTHGNATDENQMALEPGTRVFSDRLKASTGKTFAEEADKIRKEIMKYEQILYS